MFWEWEILVAVVRVLFLLAPFMDVAKDFALVGDTLFEAKEFALAGSCRAMLVSFPAQLLLTVLARSSGEQCRKVNFLIIAICVVVAFVAGFGLFKIPTRFLRGNIVPFAWLIGFETLGVLAQVFGVASVVRNICQP